jgi:hypothetical protein
MNPSNDVGIAKAVCAIIEHFDEFERKEIIFAINIDTIMTITNSKKK